MIREVSNSAKWSNFPRVPALFLKVPAGDGVIEVFGMFVLGEGELRLDPVYGPSRGLQQRADVAAVFGVVDLRELFPKRAVFDFFREAFEDDSFIGFLGADDDVRICGDVFRFASARAGAEPKGILPPEAPNQHEMRAVAGTRGGDPIIVRFL